jgi:alpha-tubulin suppressor-like RCC1 family protein
MNFRLAEESKIEKDVFIGVSSDPNGESMLKKISQLDIDNGTSGFDIYSNQCFIHYPYCPPRIIGYGEAYNYQLGNEKTELTLVPVEFSNFAIPVKSIRSCGDFTVVLDQNGELYYTGYKDTFSVTNYKLTKYHKLRPEEKIIRVECAQQNVVVLTEDHKIYIEGYDYLYHIDSYSSYKYDFWHKKRPEEETEKIVDFAVGYYFNAYITDNGKLYGAGNSLLNYYNCSKDNADYI